MLIVLSPSKTLDPEAPVDAAACTQPAHLLESRRLVRRLRELSAEDLAGLMHISPKLAELNFERYRQWKTPFTPSNARPAALAFKGDVYTGLGADDFSADDLDCAQDCLRILSGLYGLLRPLDLIQPYRLEMGTRLSNPRGANLYEFWGGRISADMRATLAGQRRPTLVNLASQEYYRAVRPRELGAPVVTPVFKERRNGSCRVIGLFAKKARGRMARYAIKNRLTRAEQLLDFAEDGYRHAPELSGASEWVFVR